MPQRSSPLPCGSTAPLQLYAERLVERLAEKGAFTEADKEIIALIAYLQKLGTYREAGDSIDTAENP